MSTTQTPTGTPPPSTERAGWWQRQTTTARVLVVAVPLLVVVLLVVVFFPRSPQPAETLPATTGTSQRANACLGGSSDLNSAVQYAQANAPLTGTGAAEFLATTLRWAGNSAAGGSPARESIAKKLAAPNADTMVLSGLAWTDFGTTTVTSTFADGYYRVDSATDAAATVTIAGSTSTTEPGATTVQRYLFGTYNLAATNGVWTVQSRLVQPWEKLGDADKQANQSAKVKDLQTTGLPFQGSC